MKKLLLLFVFLSSALLGNAQDVVKLTDGSPAWVPNYLIIEGNLYFLEDGTYTSLGDSLFNYVRKKDSSNLYYTPRQIDSLLDGKGYADTLWVQNTIHDSLTAFESSKWYDTPTGIAYDNDVEIGGSLRMPTLILNDSTMNYATFGNTIATKEYVDDMSGLGSGFTANVFFRTDYSDVPVGSEYRRIAYEPEETETILNRTINAGMGETLFTTYLYDDSLGTDLLDAGVYSVVYSCKVSNSSHVTQLAFEAFVRSTDGTETTLFKMYGEDINEVDDFVFFFDREHATVV